MQITYQFRLYPTLEQEELMIRTLILCRKLYNRAKEQRDTVYNQEGKTVTYAKQQNELPAFKKEFPEYKEVHSQVLQDCLRRLDDAYQRFFRGDAGFPHYKSADRYLSFTYPQPVAVSKAVEQLKVKNMIRNRRLSKSISDAGWRRFITYLSYKAARQGKRLVQVPAHGTSQTCICGAEVPKTLAIRLHECKACRLVQDRDIVSAQVILQRALGIVA